MDNEDSMENAAPIVQPVDPNAKIIIKAIDETEVSAYLFFKNYFISLQVEYPASIQCNTITVPSLTFCCKPTEYDTFVQLKATFEKAGGARQALKVCVCVL
jgi:hypothetical protein